MICDNYATHKHARICAWLMRRPRFDLQITPAWSSWLNQVERWFALITNRAIRRRPSNSVINLKGKIGEFVEHYNRPRLFMWITASAESILAKLERPRKLTSH